MNKGLPRSVKIKLIAVFLLSVIVLSLLFSFLEGRQYYQRRENYVYLAANQSSIIEGAMDTVMSRVYTLSVMISASDGDTEFFKKAAQTIYDQTAEDTGLYVKNIAIAPGGVVEQVYPKQGNEALLGMDYMDTSQSGNKEAVEAYKTGHLVLTEPFKLKQGGTGVSGRLPVYVKENGKSKFWGIVSVTLDTDYMIRQFHLNYLEGSGVDYSLWYKNSEGKKIVLSGSENVPKNPIKYNASPKNLIWTLAVEPKNGWLPPLEILAGVIIILLISMALVHILATRATVRAANVKLEEIAIKDNLTGCFSRHYVNEILLNPDSRTWKDPTSEYSLAVIDVDSFKKINDTYGHDLGDRALIAVAGVLRELCDNLRGDCVIRYGGDEFIFMMNNVRHELFESRIRAILENVREIRLEGAPELRLTVSIGAVEGRRGDIYYDLFSRADEQAYISKKNGKNQYHIETL